MVSLQCRAFFREVVDNRKDAEPPASPEAVGDEIHRPMLIRPLWPIQNHPQGCAARFFRFRRLRDRPSSRYRRSTRLWLARWPSRRRRVSSREQPNLRRFSASSFRRFRNSTFLSGFPSYRKLLLPMSISLQARRSLMEYISLNNSTSRRRATGATTFLTARP